MQKIWQEAEALQTELVERRRDLHRHPETGWTEFRTASIVPSGQGRLAEHTIFR